MKICFVLRDAFNVFTGSSDAVLSGAELQMHQIASYLQKKGHSVSLITEVPDYRDHNINEIEIFALPRPWEHLDYIRISKGLLKGIKSIDADVYISRILNVFLPILQLGSQFHHKSFVFSTASSMDVDGTYLKTLSQPYRWVCEWGLRNCVHVISQTIWQKKMLEKGYNRKSYVIGNSIDLTFWDNKKKQYSPKVLWIGNIRPVKRFDRLIDIARLCPKVTFIVAGCVIKASTDVFSDLPDNIKILGAVRRTEIRELMSNSSILLNTSDSEGFPNTLLEARAMGLYVICINLEELKDDMFSPDVDLGCVACNCKSAAKSINDYIESSQDYKKQYSSVAREWAQGYSIDCIGAKWENLLLRIVKANKISDNNICAE